MHLRRCAVGAPEAAPPSAPLHPHGSPMRRPAGLGVSHDDEHDEERVHDARDGPGERLEDLAQRLDALEEAEDAERAHHAQQLERPRQLDSRLEEPGDGDGRKVEDLRRRVRVGPSPRAARWSWNSPMSNPTPHVVRGAST